MEYKINDNFKIINDNSQNMLEHLNENSIDSIVCDPPYELGFMGKKWDGTGIAYDKDFWGKCFKVLKDGGYLLAFGGSRTFHRIACAIEDAGFEIRDCIMWLYGSGFPKSQDIGKIIDKKGGNNYSLEFAKDLKKARESRNLSVSYCDKKYCGGTTNWSWYEGRVAGCRVPDYETFLKIASDFKELDKYKDLIKAKEREVIGTIKRTKGIGIPACGEDLDRTEYDYELTKPNTKNAQQRNGFGTSLKPAYEPIIMARKPFKGTLVDNVLENGVGAINIDECRVPTDDYYHTKAKKTPCAKGYQRKNKSMFTDKNESEMNPLGRFPANVITDGSEEVAQGMPNTKSTYNPNVKHQETINRENADVLKYGYSKRIDSSSYNDEGSAMRYFYCAKASKKDRDEGLRDFEEQQVGSLKGGESNKKEIDDVSQRFRTIKKNIHPTVKPTELMQYLVRLVSPKGATILDPFNGSGSTGKAVAFENRERNTNYKYIGFELEKEYVDISIARINYALNKYEYDKEEERQEQVKKGAEQLSLF